MNSDPDFPESLIDFQPPIAPFMTDTDNFVPPPKPFGQNPNRLSSNNPFAKMQAG